MKVIFKKGETRRTGNTVVVILSSKNDGIVAGQEVALRINKSANTFGKTLNRRGFIKFVIKTHHHKSFKFSLVTEEKETRHEISLR